MAERAPPRYRRLAATLRAAITSGRLRPGDQLPTEMELCVRHGVSRHTAREALRLLADDGLIERRQGAGSVVVATPTPAFVQAVGDFDGILQYAREASFVCDASGAADPARLAAAGLDGAYRWFSGVRQVEAQPPIAYTTILIAATLAPPAETLHRLAESVSEWLEREHGIRIETVEQRIEAVALEVVVAERLGVVAESPALRTVRHYRDADARVVLHSESLHPAGRFAYVARMVRER
ncbi:MAG: GntR family transcriptional regulator [Gammaproteobacteria bacterium]